MQLINARVRIIIVGWIFSYPMNLTVDQHLSKQFSKNTFR